MKIEFSNEVSSLSIKKVKGDLLFTMGEINYGLVSYLVKKSDLLELNAFIDYHIIRNDIYDKGKLIQDILAIEMPE